LFFSFRKSDYPTRVKTIVWSLALILLGILFTAYSPTEFLFHALGYENSNGCPLLTFLGIPCPLCGMGRGLWSMLSLDFASGVYYNPSSVVFYPLTAAVLAGVLLSALFGYRITVERGAAFIFAAVFLLIWVLNILYGHH